MKNILLLACSLFIAALTNAQNYDVLTYNLDSIPANGVKIKTNMPFANSNHMPTIIIEGYCYGTTKPVGLLLTYYIFGNAFIHTALSSYGAFTPSVYLANEDGKVVIFIDSRDYFLRFSVRAFAQGNPGETLANFSGWTTVDEALSGSATATVQVPYKNQFEGDVYLPGGSIWRNNGRVGIGTVTPQAKLAVNGDIFSQKVKVTQTGWADFVFEPEYRLRSLPELEVFILSNKHLPDVPAGKEIANQGLDLGEMDKKLLQKIEELTLYLIEENKKNRAQQEMIDALKTEVLQLKSKVQ